MYPPTVWTTPFGLPVDPLKIQHKIFSTKIQHSDKSQIQNLLSIKLITVYQKCWNTISSYCIFLFEWIHRLNQFVYAEGHMR